MFERLIGGTKFGELHVISAGDGTGKSKFKELEQPTLEEILTELCNYGKPSVGVYGNKGIEWHCSIEMNTNTVGAEFKCKSDWKHPTPTEAALLCLERVLKAVEQYRK